MKHLNKDYCSVSVRIYAAPFGVNQILETVCSFVFILYVNIQSTFLKHFFKHFMYLHENKLYFIFEGQSF